MNCGIREKEKLFQVRDLFTFLTSTIIRVEGDTVKYSTGTNSDFLFQANENRSIPGNRWRYSYSAGNK
jgi:hypothetical protein